MAVCHTVLPAPGPGSTPEQTSIDFDRLPVAAIGFDEHAPAIEDGNRPDGDGDAAGFGKPEPQGGERRDLPAAREGYEPRLAHAEQAPGSLEPLVTTPALPETGTSNSVLELELQTDLTQTKIVTIKLRPDLSGQDHIAHVRKLVEDGGGSFEFYRAETGA